MFSSRLPGHLVRNRVALAVERCRAQGVHFADLTESNPTRVGFDYPAALLEPLAGSGALVYEPCALGLPVARAAVAADFERRGVPIPAEHTVITASTSEAYSLLFKLLCDPGDVVLAPRPSYPLVEHLTGLDDVRVEFYEAEYHGVWSVDLDGLARAIASGGAGSRVRAVIIVSPNNPTGSWVKADELRRVASLCRAHDLALVGDEVFADYPLEDDGPAPVSVLAQSEALTFGLGGCSKSAGLPQVKFGWMGVAGPDSLLRPALERLEIICDTYLSVATPVQMAAPALMAGGAAVRSQIVERVRHNYRALKAVAAGHPSCTVLAAEAGWCAVVRVPATRSEEALVLDLLDREQVLVHPGYFFDFPREAFVVVSLLPEADRFRAAVERMFRLIDAAA
jgi:alanine-synthesizing transaminase